MKIAQVSPLFESVPPRQYGGTERVVSYLTEELVKLGHDVTLFASGDSVTRARLIAPCKRSVRLDPGCMDQMAPHILMLEQVFSDISRFDFVHFHIDYLHFPLSRRHREAQATTLHGRLDLPELQPLYREYREMPLISISNSQRTPLPFANWQGTVYHGLPKDLYAFHEKPGNYLAFLGRFSPEKQPDQAIEIAKHLGMDLLLAAKVDEPNREYFETMIKPALADPRIHFVGEIGDRKKNDFLGNAYAFLFPIDWPEPFGLVLIENLACGTPVIAYGNGSVPEIIEDGVTGFVVSTLEEAVRAAEKVGSLDRRKCRERFEERFTAERMAQGYVTIYEKILERETIGI